MDDPSGLAARLGLTSVRVTQKLLEYNPINPAVEDKCFYECLRLLPLFLFLQTKCGEVLGQAKMVVYFSRRRKVKDGFIVEPVTVCINMMKSRLLVDFNNYKAAGNLDSFQQVWCFNQVLVSSHQTTVTIFKYVLDEMVCTL